MKLQGHIHYYTHANVFVHVHSYLKSTNIWDVDLCVNPYKCYLQQHKKINVYYCILRGRIKGFNRSITTILFEVGSYRTVVG